MRTYQLRSLAKRPNENSALRHPIFSSLKLESSFRVSAKGATLNGRPKGHCLTDEGQAVAHEVFSQGKRFVDTFRRHQV